MKSIAYLVVGLLLIGSFAAISIGEEAGDLQINLSKNFAEPEIIVAEDFVELSIEGVELHISNPGDPMLPRQTETIELPFGTTIDSIKCSANEITSDTLSKKILPAPQQLQLGSYQVSTEPVMNTDVYSADEFYPEDWFSYHVGVGLNENNEHKTFLTINRFPVRYNSEQNKIISAKEIDITVAYNEPVNNPFPAMTEYDLVIIAPSAFETDLQPLINHKNNLNPPVTTILKKTPDIYSQYTGIDKPEKIKYFIKDAIETWNAKYILLVGGLDSLIWATAKDNVNEGSKDWWVPVRYSNHRSDEPGYCCDLYYADVYKEGGVFDNWDTDGDGIIGEYPRDRPDMYPDISLGRLACRNTREVRNVVDKIIQYESGPCDPSWFEDMLLISGDGFLDQPDLKFQWDTTGEDDGDYTIYAYSKNPDMTTGISEEIHVTLDRTKETVLTFNHDDNLRLPGFPDYPTDPVAEIVSVTEGDILGNTDFSYTPKEGEAYCNAHTHWANLRYYNGILYIRGKTYDPKPYGNVSTIYVEVKDSSGTTVFSDHKTTEMYYEGEWTTGDVLLNGRAGGPYYMPSNFNFNYIWASNGNWEGETDVKNAFDQGSGFTFFSGHGSPNVWANHYPGIPGNRKGADIVGLRNTNIYGFPIFPMEWLKNKYKNPIVAVGGCHNSMFNVTFISTLLDKTNDQQTHCYGIPTAESWSWWLTRLSKKGAIATMGNTGYGYGILGEYCTSEGVDNWITTEFFRQYGTEGQDVLGIAYSQTLTSYIDTFGKTDSGHRKTVEQWVLHGDPSLKIGGYETAQQNIIIDIDENGFNTDGQPNIDLGMEADINGGGAPISYQWSIDKDGDGIFTQGVDSFPTGETISETWEKPGVYWIKLDATYEGGETETTYTIAEIGDEEEQFPTQPTRPAGPTTTSAGIKYTYTTKATDPFDFDLWYVFDWGDDEYDVVFPTPSGQTVSSSHSWKQKGSYEVKVLAVNDMGYFGEWSEPLTVSVTKAKSKNIYDLPIFQFLQKFFESHPNIFPIVQKILGL